VAEHGADRLQAHAAVDGLGGQGVPQLMRVDVRKAGGGSGLVDEPVERAAVLPRQQQRMVVRHVLVSVVVDQAHQVGVQRQVAVVAQLADMDV
jgi:hypothetical protein